MKIIITEPELTQIVRSHVLSTVQLQNGSDISIDFSATRGADGITASIDIPYVGMRALDLDAVKLVKGEDKPPQTAPTKPATATKKPAAAQTQAASDTAVPAVGIFAQAQQEANAAVAGTDASFPLAGGAEEGDTAPAAAVGTAAGLEGDAEVPKAGVTLFP
jgi:hypothetical protein